MSERVRTASAAGAGNSCSGSGDDQFHSLASFTEESSVSTETIQEKTVRQGNLAVEVVKPKFQLSQRALSWLMRISFQAGWQLRQASEWERQTLIHDIELLNGDSLEWLKGVCVHPSLGCHGFGLHQDVGALGRQNRDEDSVCRAWCRRTDDDSLQS